jgi:hypothetical protein
MGDLEHFGIKGMHWGRHKAPQHKTLRDQAVDGLLHDVGKVAAIAVINKYGHLALPAAKATLKGSATVIRYSGKTARGAATTIRVLGVIGKYAFRFGKAYGRTTIKLAKLGR